MRSNRGSLVKALLALVALTSLVAGDAGAARKARATGFFRINTGPANQPLQFVISPLMMGSHALHLGFPNDDAMFDGDIALFGKSPAGFTLPMNLVSGTYSALLPLMGTMNVQVSSMFGIFAPMTSGGAMFFAGGGPGGTFSFCPGSIPGVPGAACPTTGLGAPNLMAPPQGTGTRNGRLVYLGGGGFGGVARALVAGSGSIQAPRPGFGFGSPIFQAGQMAFGGGASFPIGGGYGLTLMRSGMAANYTQPKTAPTTAGVITGLQFGPQVTSMNALTSCPATPMGGAYPNIPLTGTGACVSGTGPLLIGSLGGSTLTGFPFTTATVILQNSTNTAANGVGDFVTITGSDTRTPRGIGNIALVAGSMRLGIQGNVGGPPFHNVWSLTISEKTPTMTPGGLAAAVVLMLLAAGYAMRPRP